ncbi:hypothetical protein FA95DRAFT_1558570 [Auriscalpium vulgare]|uniref:Uncharacterized protein n=1 Tax=Auriscalpium vulgare TaxID=40419 RepID=A0ACB8RWC6_9AGAM|nr:hypothetical protein FA95DRAFT_1558570 [Auriscalpium vulgare]
MYAAHRPLELANPANASHYHLEYPLEPTGPTDVYRFTPELTRLPDAYVPLEFIGPADAIENSKIYYGNIPYDMSPEREQWGYFPEFSTNAEPPGAFVVSPNVFTDEIDGCLLDRRPLELNQQLQLVEHAYYSQPRPILPQTPPTHCDGVCTSPLSLDTRDSGYRHLPSSLQFEPAAPAPVQDPAPVIPHATDTTRPAPVTPPTANTVRLPPPAAAEDDRRLRRKVIRPIQSMACLFCRARKIACGPSNLTQAYEKTCGQCARRGLVCEYPKESRRGLRLDAPRPVVAAAAGKCRRIRI